jgi:hypothetical protein
VRYSSLGTDPSLGTVPDPGAKRVPVPGPELISKERKITRNFLRLLDGGMFEPMRAGEL